MKSKIIFSLCCLLNINSFSQQVERQTVASSGSYLFSNGVLIRQTVGQPFHTQTYYSNDISFRPGFQQPQSIFKQGKSLIQLSIFPNPARDFVMISSAIMLEKVTLNLYDNFGKILTNHFFESFNQYQLDCTVYPSGLYFINLTSAKQQFNTCKLLIY
jgi:hypothetical protein